MNGSIIDVQVNLSRWPTRRLRDDDTKQLLERLLRFQVVEAWAGSYDGLLHRDIRGVNERLAADCSRFASLRLRPFGTVNPKSPDWEEDLRRCAEDLKMPGLRLFPNYHGYKLDDSDFHRLLRRAADLKMIVSIPVQMEDERMMHPLLQVKPVDITPLAKIIPTISELKMVLHNTNRNMRALCIPLLQTGRVWMDIAMLDGLDVISEWLENAPLDGIVFGSHAPFHYWEASLLKLHEAQLENFRHRAICFGNARRLLAE